MGTAGRCAACALDAACCASLPPQTSPRTRAQTAAQMAGEDAISSSLRWGRGRSEVSVVVVGVVQTVQASAKFLSTLGLDKRESSHPWRSDRP